MTLLQNNETTGWTITEWLNAYRSEGLQARDALLNLRAQLKADDAAWIYIVSVAEIEAQLSVLASLGDATSLPLYGIPFAVKDNIDVAGMPTTAACPAFTYIAEADATSVARLKQAGQLCWAKPIWISLRRVW